MKRMENSILKNKNCLITGATGGLGKEIAMELAKKGANLFLTSKKEDLQKLRLEIKKNNEIIVEYQCVDLRTDKGVETLIENIRKKFSTIDILINCAGENHRKPLSESTIEEYDSCMNLNVRAPFVLSKEFSKDMIKNKWGRIVNIASSGAYNGLKNTSIYRSSKHALLGLSRSLSNELKEFNVRTFCFSPGPMKTQMGKEIINKENPSEIFETFMQTNEIAEFIIFVISFENNLMSPEIRMGRTL
jgi:2-dehydro-3-deoxy-D-gluconate 5-dehydrogenase